MNHVSRIRSTVAALLCAGSAFLFSTSAIAQGHGHDGPRSELGTTTVAELKFTAIQIGKVEAGKEGVFEVEPEKDAKAPKAVRIWVGNASAEGSTKTKAEKHGDGYEAHVELPKELKADTQLWVEIEPAAGKRAKAGFDLKKD